MNLDVLCVGQATIDQSFYLTEYPPENGKAETTEMIECGGGPAANAACLVSRWGLGAAFAGLVGADEYGGRIRKDFDSFGVDVSLLESRPGHATPLSVILVNSRTGSRTIVNRKSPAAALRLGGTGLASMRPKWLLFDGHEGEASREALALFPEAGSILDAGSAREGTLDLAGRVDYLIASERFAVQVTGEDGLSDEMAQRRALSFLKNRFSATVVVTRGEEGLIAEENGDFLRMPAVPAKTVDTTGAGDIFHGAFAHGLAMGLPFRFNLQRAMVAAALSVGVRGGRTSIPPLSQVEEALAHAG